MKLSVIMSVYNGERYIAEAIRSIVSQTFRDFEFIIIDDASTDSTKKEIEKFHDKRIKLIINKNNNGLTRNLNFAISIAKGEFIARMDADDISMPERFERQITFLEENPRVGVVGSSAIGFGDVRRKMKWPINHEGIKSMMLINNPLIHSSVMLRASVLKNMKYNEEHRTAQDYELWSRLIWTTEFANLLEPLIRYRIHRKQTTILSEGDQNNSANYARLYMLSKVIVANKEDQHLFLRSCSPNPGLNIREIDGLRLLYKEILSENERSKTYCQNELLSALTRNYDRALYTFTRSQGNPLLIKGLIGLGGEKNIYTLKKYIGPALRLMRKY